MTDRTAAAGRRPTPFKRTAAERDGAASVSQEDERPEHSETGSDESVLDDRRRARRAMVLRLLSVIIVLACGTTVLAAVRSAAPANTAVADSGATTEVTDQVGDALKAVFSYDYENMARTERAASEFLTGAAVNQYQGLFAAAKAQAISRKLVRATSIGSVGVQDLSGDHARLLVFLGQQTLTTTTDQQASSTAAVEVLSRKINGRWKIEDLTAQ